MFNPHTNTQGTLASAFDLSTPLPDQDKLEDLNLKRQKRFAGDRDLCNPEPLLAFCIHDCLSPTECMNLIVASERLGYEKALVNIGFGRQKKMEDFRNNDRCVIDCPKSAEILFNRIKDFVPKQWNGRSLVGLNERLRFLRYKPGQKFEEHCDGCYIRTNGPQKGEQSFLTLQLYLNTSAELSQTQLERQRPYWWPQVLFSAKTKKKQDENDNLGASGNCITDLGHGLIDMAALHNLKGGTTRFTDPYHLDVVPVNGKVLIFQHDIMHQGSKVTAGIKYAIRTDVMYSASEIGNNGRLDTNSAATASSSINTSTS